MSSRHTLPMFMILLFACFPVATTLAGGEISFLGAYNSGDYGTGVDSDSQSYTLRYVSGDAFQFRVELPMLRVRSTYGVLQTGFGSTPLDEEHHGGPMGGHDPGHGGRGMKLDEDPAADPQWNTGIGDLRVSASKRLMGGGVKLFRLDAGLELKVPSADEEQNLGTGEWDTRLSVSGAYRFWSATGFGGLGYNTLGDPEWVELEDVFDAHIGLESDPLIGGRVTLSGWIEGREEVVKGVGSHAAIGVGLQGTGRWRWRGALVAGLSAAAQDFSLVFGVSYGLAPKAWNKGLYR